MLPQKLTLTLRLSALKEGPSPVAARAPPAELPSEEILAFGPDSRRFRPRTYRAEASSLFLPTVIIFLAVEMTGKNQNRSGNNVARKGFVVTAQTVKSMNQRHIARS